MGAPTFPLSLELHPAIAGVELQKLSVTATWFQHFTGQIIATLPVGWFGKMVV